ncbi:MAG TPA: amino acid adenylation domain-containing protein, partial [Myxococcus sp.]|nr:amino acid adenylation domain-containing protein [Myxococcus sp.]
MSSLKDRLAALTPEQRRELAQRLKQQSAPAPAQKPAQPSRPREGLFPLSENQWSMWFLHQLAPQSPSYNVALALRVRGVVDPVLLERCLDRLAERHPILRTTYETHEEKPVQRVHARLPLVLTRHAAPGLTEEGLDEQLRASYLRPFDLERGPVWRADLFTRAPTEHVLLLVIHHIATDLWSMGMMMDELQHLYRGELRGEPVSLPPLKLDYVDSVELRRQQQTPERQALLWEYWQSQLREPPGPLELPTDLPRPARWSFRGATLPIRLGPELSAGLRSLARAEGKTLYTVLLAGFLTLLHRYTGQTDILCGSPLWGRTHPDLQRLAGYFVNFVALRGDLSGDPPFTELLQRLYPRVLGAIEHQDYPFHALGERLGVKPDPSRPRLVEVEFSYDQFNSMPGLDVARDDVQMELKPFLRQQEGQFAVNLMLVDVAGEIAGALKYSTDLFTPETMVRFWAQLRALFTSVLRNPRQRLSALSLLADADRRQLLETFNATQAPVPPHASVHAMFEAQAARTPGALAVDCEGHTLTFSALNARANQLAWHLRGLGVGPDVPVALCLERSVDMVVALLGVMKAGGCYVPMDPAWPAQRLDFTVRDCGAPVLLTSRKLADTWTPAGTRVLCLDTEAPVLDAHLTEDLPPVGLPDNLAYIIYTSGSTGTPKGVMIQHRSVLNLQGALRQSVYVGQPEGLRVSVNAPLAFDASVKQWVQLLDGHCLCIVPEATRQDPEAMLRWVERHRVDVLDCTPSLLRLMVQAGLLRSASAPKLLVPGGEAIDELLWRRLAEAPCTRTFNVYGPTECTVDTTAFGVHEGTRPTIGGPLANVRVYVLDAHLRPAPVGVPGELFISGAGVARGYLGRPELSAERFLPNPFSPTPGERMYRTGDKVRWLPDGTLEYLGRIDFQVKVRGFRIELGEIEACLRQHPGVQQAVVLAREDAPGDKRLVGYFTLKGAPVELAGVRAFLKERLPEYMVPGALVVLEALPLTSNGKVDRRALPAPDVSAASGAYVPPATPTEELLAAAWAQVLRVERVGRHDDFFALGGHSLLATQVMARVRSSFGVELPLRVLFEASTLEALALQVDVALRSGWTSSLPPLVPVSRQGRLPVSFSQQRLWFLDQLMPGQVSYNVPIVLRLSGALDVGALHRTMEELVRRHEALRTTFASEEGQPYQVIHPAGPLELPVASLEHLAPEAREAEARTLALEVVRQPLDLARGPLQRAKLLRLDASEHVLALAVHHIVSDGWSMGVMVRELGALYEAFSQGRPSPLPELPLQYADYAAWQRQWLVGAPLEQQLDYWRQALAGLAPLNLPTDKPRPAVQRYRGATLGFTLPKPLADGLKALARQEGTTLFMVLLGAWQVLLHRYSGQDDIAVGTPVAGRKQPEVEGLIGFFVNTLVLRMRLGGTPSFREVLARVKESTLGAYAHQDLPFEKLVEELEPRRDLSRQPLFQVAFMLANVPLGELSLPGVAVRREVLETQTSKFDLSLSLTETAEGLEGALEYATDLYAPATVARLAGHLRVLLESIVQQPGQRCSALALMDAAERRQVLVEWNATQGPYPRDAAVHEVFEAQVELTPDAVAVTSGSEVLTYAQLEARANQLAGHLRARGLMLEERVGLCLERSVDLTVAMLGVLKAGGVYVPLDPAYPAERLGFMVQDSRVRLLVTHGRLAEALDTTGLEVVRLDADRARLDAVSVERLRGGAGPRTLAYVIYTSGSTGRPKGVEVEHRPIVRLVKGTDFVQVRAGDRMAQLSNTSFDAATFEVWGALLNGAALVVVAREVALAPVELSRV